MSGKGASARREIPISRALALTLIAGGIGWATDRAAVHAGWRFPSAGYFVAELVWKLATLGVMAWALHRYESRRLDSQTTGFTPDPNAEKLPFPVRSFAIASVAALVLSATIGRSASDASAYGNAHEAGTALVLAEVLLRYPLTVFAEEAFFRGWLQPRLGRNGPVLSAVLWAVYHLQQTSTIPSLVVFGLALGALRWWRGTVRVGATAHYLADVVFFLATYG